MNMYNMNGTDSATTFNGTVGPAVRASLLARQNPLPLVVSFNEICPNVWIGLWLEYFASRGDVAQAHWGVNSVNQTCGQFGSVVVVKGTSGFQSSGTFVKRATGQAANKGWACVATNLYTFVGCTTHLTHLRAPNNIRQDQLLEFKQVLQPYVNQGSVFWASGDLNMESNEDPAFNAWWYQNFREADTFNRTKSQKRPTTDNGGSPNTQSVERGIDYIFRRRQQFVGNAPYIYDSPHSDHHWYQMYM